MCELNAERSWWKKIRWWKFGGKFLASRYFSKTFQVSNSELLRDTIFKFAAFSKALIGYQEK